MRSRVGRSPGRPNNAPGSAVTVTTSAEVVRSSTRRLSHHRMMSGNVCDGLELVRRAYNGRVIMAYALSSPSGGVAVGVNKVVHTSFKASCPETCPNIALPQCGRGTVWQRYSVAEVPSLSCSWTGASQIIYTPPLDESQPHICSPAQSAPAEGQ